MAKKTNVKVERVKRLKKRVTRTNAKEKEVNSCTKLCAALEELGYVEVRSHQISDDNTKMKIVHRVHDRKAWTPVQNLLLREESRVGGRWTIFNGIQFHLNPSSRKGIGYLWVLMVQGDLDQASNDMCRILDLVSSDLVSLPVEREERRPLRRFTQKGNGTQRKSDGVVYAGGQVLEYPLMAKEGRNKPEVSLFAPVGSRKGAHYISQGR